MAVAYKAALRLLGKSADLVINEGLTENLSAEFQRHVQVASRIVIVSEACVAPSLIDTCVRQITHANLKPAVCEVANTASPDEIIAGLVAQGCTKDDLLLCVGSRQLLWGTSQVAPHFCGGVQLAYMPLSYTDLLCACMPYRYDLASGKYLELLSCFDILLVDEELFSKSYQDLQTFWLYALRVGMLSGDAACACVEQALASVSENLLQPDRDTLILLLESAAQLPDTTLGIDVARAYSQVYGVTELAANLLALRFLMRISVALNKANMDYLVRIDRIITAIMPVLKLYEMPAERSDASEIKALTETIVKSTEDREVVSAAAAPLSTMDMLDAVNAEVSIAETDLSDTQNVSRTLIRAQVFFTAIKAACFERSNRFVQLIPVSPGYVRPTALPDDLLFAHCEAQDALWHS